MSLYQFSLLVQAAGTILLFVVFLLLYRKFRRPAFLDWIASWGFFLAALAFRWLVPVAPTNRLLLFALRVATLTHVFFLLRGVWRYRTERPVSRPAEMLWAIPIVALSWWLALSAPEPYDWAAPISFIRAGAYLVTAFAFAVTPGSAGGRAILALSFLLWGVLRALVGQAYLEHGGADLATMPEAFQYAHFVEMFLEMTVGVGIIILLFEASQSRLESELKALAETDTQAREMGIRDKLTGLYNRHYFNDVIRRELAKARRYGTSLSVMLIDVDRFKEINDVRGHAVGDEVLQFVAHFLTACVRESDLVFRWGGDEFLILLTQANEAAAAQKSEELARSLPHIPGAEQLQPTLSVGWATHHTSTEFPRTLAEADSRMYEMKQSRRKQREARERDLGRVR